MSVHVLHEGRTGCDLPGPPSSWHPAQQWVPRERAGSATCDICVAVEKARRIAEQWPKKCGCGREYGEHPSMTGNAVEPVLYWGALQAAYEQVDAYARFDARHCACGSTLMVITEILNLAEE